MHGMGRLQQDVPWLKQLACWGVGAIMMPKWRTIGLIIESLLMAQAMAPIFIITAK